MLLLGDIVRKTNPAMFWCIRSLPKAEREAVYTIFAFCRHLSLIISSDMPHEEKADLLHTWQEELNNIYDTKVPASNIGRKIYKNCLRFDLPKQMWQEILDSATMYMSPLVAPQADEFEKYVRGIAIVPVNLYLAIINNEHPQVNADLANYLGKAVTLTYILRNVKDDAKSGKVFIAREILETVGIENYTPQQVIENVNLPKAREILAEQAKSYYGKAERLLAKMNRRDTLLLRLIKNRALYLFEVMEKRGWEIISPKPKISVWQQIKIFYSTLTK